jgi:hypothetical protein
MSRHNLACDIHKCYLLGKPLVTCVPALFATPPPPFFYLVNLGYGYWLIRTVPLWTHCPDKMKQDEI